jgi:hypothetical protein
MAKSNLKIDLSTEKNIDLFFMGISSSTGIAVIANLINRYLSIELSYYEKMMAMQQEVVLESLPIFTSFEPQVNEMNTTEEIDVFDLRLPTEKEQTKYLLMQTKGDKANLFPKINPMDFIFVSNYSMEKYIEVVKSIPETTLCYELKKQHLGKRYDYFRKLFYN